MVLFKGMMDLGATLQTLVGVVKHHLYLLKQLQQQMWLVLGASGQAANAAVLLGLHQRYAQTAEAMLSIAAPISIAGMPSHPLKTCFTC